MRIDYITSQWMTDDGPSLAQIVKQGRPKSEAGAAIIIHTIPTFVYVEMRL